MKRIVLIIDKTAGKWLFGIALLVVIGLAGKYIGKVVTKIPLPAPKIIIMAKNAITQLRELFVNSPEGIITTKKEIIISNVEYDEKSGVMRIRKGAKISMGK